MRKFFLILLSVVALASASKAQGTGINSSGASPDNSAMLDVSATDKGLLIPRISLIDTTDATTIASPAHSLIVYNTSVSGGLAEGYYFNSGTPSAPRWKQLLPNPANQDLDMGNNKITNLATCTQNLDAANKAYVDALVAGLPAGSGCCGPPQMLSPVSPASYSISGAVAYCDNLNYGGYTDWRLPTFGEIVYFIGSTADDDTLWTLSPTSPDRHIPGIQNYVTVKLNDGKWFNGNSVAFETGLFSYTAPSWQSTSANTWTTIQTWTPQYPWDAFRITYIYYYLKSNSSSSTTYGRIRFTFADGSVLYGYSFSTSSTSGSYNYWNITPVNNDIPLIQIDLQAYASTSGYTASGYIANLSGTPFILHQKDGKQFKCKCVR